MTFQQLLLDATEAVLTWEIPEEDLCGSHQKPSLPDGGY